jgi:multimeric flavodoxin WrbA
VYRLVYYRQQLSSGTNLAAIKYRLRQCHRGINVHALVLNCTLKASPEPSNTEALARVLMDALQAHGVTSDLMRVVDHRVYPGVSSDQGDGDEWPRIRDKILASEILVIATPTWLGTLSSVAKRVLERMDAMLSEADDKKRPVAYNHVAGVVVTGNEDGAHHVISEISGALIDIGFTVPGQSWTYWNAGPGPGPSYSDTDHGHEWSHRTARMAAGNLVAVARAFEKSPMPPPSS